ncbi:MAG: type II toxin-antitoxin system VapC family toxin [Bacteroidales bacterium]|jgi:tRNA(fMet)-specific endonuclease VapC|nr:type II toxin-antitoxin system VapC family toxin [Bacteroidales bacterium]
MYLLDTNICIYIINNRSYKTIEKISCFKPSQIKISSITVAELEYGVSKSQSHRKNRDALLNFLSPFEIVNFNAADAKIYGIIRAALEQDGKVIGPYDMQLAAQALNRNYVFVTNNVKEFQRIDKLVIENWV